MDDPDLRATLVRVVAFFPFAIAYLALLLDLVATEDEAGVDAAAQAFANLLSR